MHTVSKSARRSTHEIFEFKIFITISRDKEYCFVCLPIPTPTAELQEPSVIGQGGRGGSYISLQPLQNQETDGLGSVAGSAELPSITQHHVLWSMFYGVILVNEHIDTLSI